MNLLLFIFIVEFLRLISFSSEFKFVVQNMLGTSAVGTHIFDLSKHSEERFSRYGRGGGRGGGCGGGRG